MSVLDTHSMVANAGIKLVAVSFRLQIMERSELTAKAARQICESSSDHHELMMALSSISESPWTAEDEYFQFLENVSIELLSSAAYSKPEAFGWDMSDENWLRSPLFNLWKEALAKGDKQMRHKQIELEENLANTLDSEHIELLAAIPLASALCCGFWEALLTGVSELSFEQEEFLGYAIAALRSRDIEPPMDIFPILGIPSCRILREEVLADWNWFPELWTPRGILQWLLENPHADQETKSIVSRILRCEGMEDWEKDEWREHMNIHWTEAEISKALEKCQA